MRISVDFNTTTEDGRVSLKTRGAQQSLERHRQAGNVLDVGELVWLQDEDFEVMGRLEFRQDGLCADPQWDTLRYFDEDR